MSSPHTVTSLQNAPELERRSRMIKYTVAMGIRLACIGACFLVSGWWLLIPALGAIILPYFAVVLANSATKEGEKSAPLRPGTVSVTHLQ
jgi:purine-cytosine permease-like protein